MHSVNSMKPINKESVKKRNIALNIKTYRRLESLKANLIKEKLDPNLTYDDVISILLDNGGW